MTPDYDFQGDDMCQGLKAAGKDFLARFIGQPCSCLEVGVYEGRSGCWLLDNILTHPDSSYTGIDLGEKHQDALRRGVRNLMQHQNEARTRITAVEDDSRQALPNLICCGRRYDIIHIDGDHGETGCREDLFNSRLLLKPGGMLIVDDYLHPDYGVKRAVDGFLSGFREGVDYQFLYQDYLVAWEFLTRPFQSITKFPITGKHD